MPAILPTDSTRIVLNNARDDPAAPSVSVYDGQKQVGALDVTSVTQWSFISSEATPASQPKRGDILLYSSGLPAEGAYCRECNEVVGYTHESNEHFGEHSEDSPDMDAFDAFSSLHVPIDPFSDFNRLNPTVELPERHFVDRGGA